MNIYIDESGSFVNAPNRGTWNAVAALAMPEVGRGKLDALVRKLRRQAKPCGAIEVKLNDLTENQYLAFLQDLYSLHGVVFCTATDAGLNTTQLIIDHQQHQVGRVLMHIDKMKYEGGRRGLQLLADHFRKLSPQLYVQLTCQIDLMFEVVSRSITYFAQRYPATLREFRWRVDQKNSERPTFEEAFERLSPPLLQTRSFEQPLMMVNGFDYSHMKQYEFPDGQPPRYLKEAYGIEAGSGFNIQKLVRGNMQFVDSKESEGVQATDLIASGIRRCLRHEFHDNERAAVTLGKLMLQAVHNNPSINLVTLGMEARLPKETARLVWLMTQNSRRMLG